MALFELLNTKVHRDMVAINANGQIHIENYH